MGGEGKFKTISMFVLLIFCTHIESIEYHGDLLDCTSQRSSTSHSPVCTIDFDAAGATSQGNFTVYCINLGLIRIVGNYDIISINCSATYPLDFNFDGILPTEAIDVVYYRRMRHTSSSNLFDVESYHADILIFSVPALYHKFSHDHPNMLRNSIGTLRPNYSRTGNYAFSGYRESAKWTAEFYLFLEGANFSPKEHAIYLTLYDDYTQPSFIRNNHLELQLSNLSKALMTGIPCRASHLTSNVTLLPLDVAQYFQYDVKHGFLPREQSLQKNSVTENSVSTDRLECVLDHHEMLNVDRLQFRLSSDPETQYGFNGLSKAGRDASISFKSELIQNGTVVATTAKCRITSNLDSTSGAIFTSMVGLNTATHLLRQHFVLPEFVNRSYTLIVGVQSEELNREISWPQQVLSSALGGVAFCGDRENFKLTGFGMSLKNQDVLQFNFDTDWRVVKRDKVPSHFYISLKLWTAASQALYANYTKIIFRCQVHPGVLVRPVVWYVQRNDGQVQKEWTDYDFTGDFSYFSAVFPESVRTVACAASFWHNMDWRNSTVDLQWTSPEGPAFIKAASNRTTSPARDPTDNEDDDDIYKFRLGSRNIILKCSASGSPTPDVYWEKDGKNVTEHIVGRGSGETELTIPALTEANAGVYLCIASNTFGLDTKPFHLILDESDQSSMYWALVGIPVTLIVVISFVALLYLRYLRKEVLGLTKYEIEAFLNGEERVGVSADGTNKAAGTTSYAHESSQFSAYNLDYEIPPSNFQIDKTSCLGSGAFGVVLKALLNGEPVAAKTVRQNVDKNYLKALLSELKIMIFLGHHENVVRVLGAYTKDLKKGSVYIFVEFCGLGSLETYLRENRHLFQFNPAKTNTTSEGLTETLALNDLYVRTGQICAGLEFLSSKNVLHGDLATRNILLTNDRTAKITDFGLSRQLYNYAQYVKTQQDPLPWRWMAPESLRDLQFSTASDVWGFGVLCWEVFSLAATPFPGYTWTMNFIGELEGGLRLDRPHLASQGLYQRVLMECWHFDPVKRPLFSDLRARLEALYHEIAGTVNTSVHTFAHDYANPIPLGGSNENLYMNTSV